MLYINWYTFDVIFSIYIVIGFLSCNFSSFYTSVNTCIFKIYLVKPVCYDCCISFLILWISSLYHCWRSNKIHVCDDYLLIGVFNWQLFVVERQATCEDSILAFSVVISSVVFNLCINAFSSGFSYQFWSVSTVSLWSNF